MDYIIEGQTVYRTYPQGDVQIREYHDTLLHTKVAYDGTNLTATVHNYLDYPIQLDDTVTFEVNGVQTPVIVAGGVAILPHVSTGYDVVRVLHEGWRTGELTIGTKPPEVNEQEELNAMLMLQLAETEARQNASDQAMADLMFALIEGGIL